MHFIAAMRRHVNRLVVLCFILVFAIFLQLTNGEKFRQERAQLKLINKKYVSEAKVITNRPKRGAPYKTNITATILHAWGNNVTFQVSYGSRIGGIKIFEMTVKVCDAYKQPWSAEYIRAFSNVGTICPVPAGTYGFYNMELPPKNFPLPIPQIDADVCFTLYLTDSMEKILDITLILHVS